jgi:hypothetical protein
MDLTNTGHDTQITDSKIYFYCIFLNFVTDATLPTARTL